MKSLVRFFLSNWGLKLLALILALIVYYSLREGSENTAAHETNLFMKGPDTRGPVR